MKIQLTKSKTRANLLTWQEPKEAKAKKRKSTKCKNEGVVWLSVDDLIQNLSKQPKKYLPLIVQMLRTLKEKGEINENDLIKHQNLAFSLKGASIVQINE